MSRPAPPINRSAPGSGKGVDRFKRQMTPEGKAKLSELAKKRHAESDGKGFGRGQQKPGTKPRRGPSKARVAQLVAEAAREKENAERIIDVFKDGIASTQQMHIRLKAAEAWIKVEQDDAKLSLKENDADHVQRSREELLELLTGKLSEGPAAALLRRQLAEQSESTQIDDDIIDVDAEDVEEFDDGDEE